MNEPGRKLRELREQLHLKYRDIEEASHKIANEQANHEFAIGLSRLADIENKGTVPSIYRLYSLCTIYGVDFAAILEWYGVKLSGLPAEAARLGLEQTRSIDFNLADVRQAKVPLDFAPGVDLRQTVYLTRQLNRWGKLPVLLLDSLDLRGQRYAFVGTEDWSMYPLIRPGSFIQIDEAKRRILNRPWSHEHDRSIFFIEHRQGFRCGWCTERGGLMVVHSPAQSPVGPEIYKYPEEAEIVGEVVGVAMRLDPEKRRHKRS
jgi:transcriptional regulator with XRE-family HTH domain